MQLYPHNQKAYDRASEIFRYKNRTCIIHPTGTGKAVIIGKFISDNKNCKHLLLGPGYHIHKEILKHSSSKSLTFRTYQSLLTADDLLLLTGYDFIFLDEFHRLGADIWGQAIQDIINRNPSAKILGTSATHIRFLDDQRNMANELFEGNIASELSLNQAIVSGILPAPKYISALYSVQDKCKKVEGKILSSDFIDKDTVLKKFQTQIIDWERSSGLDNIIKKHLTSDRNRIIVFCRNWRHLRFALNKLVPIFEAIFPPYSVYNYIQNKEVVIMIWPLKSFRRPTRWRSFYLQLIW